MAKARRRAPRKSNRRTRWTPERAREALAELAESGKSVRAYAAERGLKWQRLYRWRQRLGTEGRAVRQAPKFVEVMVAGDGREHRGNERFEIELVGGRIVRVGPSFNAEALRQLVRLLEEDRSC